MIVDNFAGGGGASLGIEAAMGRQVDIAVNHDPAAIRMHEVNHPHTKHYCESVWDVDPKEATRGRQVELAWFSPDCRHFSRAKGGAPNRSEKVRGLAWVVLRWASAVKPRVIMLENVVEFQTWGPLTSDGRPNKALSGRTFNQWVGHLRALGYRVEWRELVAADYGAATSRRRFFLIARRDREPIVWPRETHDPASYKSAASIINWKVPVPSIFDRRKPLAAKTMARIAAGVERYVMCPDPFIVGDSVPFGVPRYGERPTQAPRTVDFRNPLPTIVATDNGAQLCAAFLARHWGGMVGKRIDEPFPTITQKGCQDQLVTCDLATQRSPQVRAFLADHLSDELAHAAPVVDIGMRQLTPRELYDAQGFTHGYVIDRDADGKPFTKTEQVRMCGNSVPPCLAEALVRANVTDNYDLRPYKLPDRVLRLLG